MSIPISNSFHSFDEQNFISKKRNRKNEICWSFEEEFLFFEAHTILGNKWKRYSQIIQK